MCWSFLREFAKHEPELSRQGGGILLHRKSSNKAASRSSDRGNLALIGGCSSSSHATEHCVVVSMTSLWYRSLFPFSCSTWRVG